MGRVCPQWLYRWWHQRYFRMTVECLVAWVGRWPDHTTSPVGRWLRVPAGTYETAQGLTWATDLSGEIIMPDVQSPRVGHRYWLYWYEPSTYMLRYACWWWFPWAYLGIRLSNIWQRARTRVRQRLVTGCVRLHRRLVPRAKVRGWRR
jgi:hypothetical protein